VGELLVGGQLVRLLLVLQLVDGCELGRGPLGLGGIGLHDCGDGDANVH
jgi:hypothetical protein